MAQICIDIHVLLRRKKRQDYMHDVYANKLGIEREEDQSPEAVCHHFSQVKRLNVDLHERKVK